MGFFVIEIVFVYIIEKEEVTTVKIIILKKKYQRKIEIKNLETLSQWINFY